MYGWMFGRMSADRALGRVRQLNRILSVRSGPRNGVVPWRTLCSATDGKVTIGDVSKIVKKPENPELVPSKYLSDILPQSTMRHLRWIMQKDSLGQDVFLIGPPGPLRRAIAMQYLELTQREVEYIALTRDTTESDLKQRREIKSGTAYYIDQCAVKAATQGRVLVLEGIEKAERNVLPVLNNLLENREMQLEDGRFLCAAQRYDKLLKEHTQDELDAWKLVRVSEDFRVIALGLPVPRYRGNPLDPPLRSRFQARDVNPLPFKDQLEMLQILGSQLSSEKPAQILSFASTLRSSELSALGLPDFPLDNLYSAIKILNTVPTTSVQKLLYQLYPYSAFLGKEGKTTVEEALKKFELIEDPFGKVHHEKVLGVEPMTHSGTNQAKAIVESKGSKYELQLPAGTEEMRSTDPYHPFIITSSHEGLLADMMLTHTVQDFCLIGPKGCGKSILAKQFANNLGYNVEPVMLYQDMTSRDLLQQRATLPNGDTRWRMSPLITAAIEGSIALLDGLHRVNPSTLAVLHRLVHDREATLFDGTRLIRHDKYEKLKTEMSMSDEEMQKRSVFPIHPSFRMIALAEPPVIGSSTQQWLNSELLTLFLYHHIKPLSYSEELQVLQGMVPEAAEESLEPLLKFTHLLRNSTDPTLQNLSSSLSTRNLLRIVNRMSKYPDESLYEAINKACLSRFLPQLAHQALDTVLVENDIHPRPEPSEDSNLVQALTCEVKDGLLRIGHTSMSIYNPENGMMVPDTLFYENPQHLAIMEDMLKDFALGEHLLLIGNQGVGKNKLADRFLHLLNKPRQYIQLHRDTTVQTLTLQPNVQDGVIVYEDSPLVKAVKYGHVLVVDEADKAPTNVTCILKSLVESGEMVLADGRKIVSGRPGLQSTDHILVTHPDFRMIVLANRPGFPFLGNDFFGALGDIFSCHAVDNPNIESEMQMLSRYGPNVPEGMLRKLVLAFGELRSMADQGMIAYPYSTREVVNMVKHLEKYPDEGLATVVNNVFDFDAYNKEMREQIVETLHKHGIPLGADPTNVNLAKEYALPTPKLSYQWTYAQGPSRRKMLCPVEEKTLRTKGPVQMDSRSFPIDRVEARASSFTEQLSCWNLPMSETNMVVDVAVSKDSTDELLHVVTCSPVCLYTMKPHGQNLQFTDLYGVFPGLQRKMVKAAALGTPLHGQVLLHEEAGNVVLLVDTNTASVHRLFLTSAFDTAKDKIMKRFTSSETEYYKMCSDFSHENWVAFYQQGGNTIDVVDVLNGKAHSIDVPIQIASLHLTAPDRWMITEVDSPRKYLLINEWTQDKLECQLNSIMEKPVEEDSGSSSLISNKQMSVSTSSLDKETLSKCVGENIEAPNRILADNGNYGDVAVGFPDLMSEVDIYTIPRPSTLDRSVNETNDPLEAFIRKSSTPTFKRDIKPAILPGAGQVIRSVPVGAVPKDVFPENKVPITIATCLEIADLGDRKCRYIPVPSPSTNVNRHMPWAPVASPDLAMATTHNEHLVTVDVSGCVRIWETGTKQLARSLGEWQKMIGAQDNRPIQITREKELGKEITSPPKHGKIDPGNTPHVGGSTWAGGTGGQGTAGLGGVGGPYRLDAGHDVFQVSDKDKANVPLEIQAAAREMAQKAFRERLREIDMSEYDAEMYEKFASNVRRQVKSLRVLLDSLQAKGKERQWLKHQPSGELDEGKLIEGLTGEKAIYKRRGDKEPEPGTPQVKPKRLRLVVDVSGSMYRFNGYDGRLDRTMESALMVMEAFEKYEEKFTFDIVGHSGEDFNIVFVNGEKPPKNNKERLDVIKKMHAHSQFCMSGDNTLEAAKFSIEDVTNKEGDEYFVIVLSDANLDRYAISPARFSQVLNSDEQVNAYAIFIGSLGDQAERLVHSLPAGKAFVCMDLKEIPQILQQIFTSTFLSSS